MQLALTVEPETCEVCDGTFTRLSDSLVDRYRHERADGAISREDELFWGLALRIVRGWETGELTTQEETSALVVTAREAVLLSEVAS